MPPIALRKQSRQVLASTSGERAITPKFAAAGNAHLKFEIRAVLPKTLLSFYKLFFIAFHQRTQVYDDHEHRYNGTLVQLLIVH